MENVKKITINGETHPIGVEWENVDSKPSFADVATSGNYEDLSNKPSQYVLPTAQQNVLGGVKVTEGNGLNNNSGQVSVNLADSSHSGTITSQSYKTLDALNTIKITAFDPNTGIINIGGKRWILEPYVEVGKGKAYYGGSFDNPTSLDEAFGSVDLNETSTFDAKIYTGTNGIRAFVAWFAVPNGIEITSIVNKIIGIEVTEDFDKSTTMIPGYTVWYCEYPSELYDEYIITVK